jgi:hypothetical protein
MASYTIDINGIVFTRAPSITSLRKRWLEMYVMMSNAEAYSDSPNQMVIHKIVSSYGVSENELPKVIKGLPLGTITLRRES